METQRNEIFVLFLQKIMGKIPTIRRKLENVREFVKSQEKVK